ncbi:MAG: beta strand repeat-containing protein, partial [Planctomycetia bacterium]
MDSGNLVGASIGIVSLLAGDVLEFVNTANITGNYDSTTGVLTLVGTDTIANYQSALRSVKFGSTSDNPTSFGTRNARTISWQVTDGNSDGVGAASSTVVTSTVNLTALVDQPVVDLDSSSVNRAQIFTSKLNPIRFTASGVNLFDVDNQTLDNLQVSFAKNLFLDGANEKLVIDGATNDEIATNLGGVGNGIGSFTLASTVFDYTISVVGGIATINITGGNGAELTLQQAESILDALRYNNLSDIRTSMPDRVFSVLATDGGGLASNVETLTVRLTPSTPSILQGSDDTGRYNNDRITSDNTLTFHGIGGIGDTVTIFSGSSSVGSGIVGVNGTFTITTSVLPNGVHNLYAVSSNSGGLSSPNSTPISWEIRSSQVVSPVVGNNFGLPQITGTGTPGTYITIQMGGATFSVPVDNNGNWTVNLSTAVPISGNAPSIEIGNYPISVIAMDFAGNFSTPVTSTLVVTTPVQPSPVVNSNPSSNDISPVVSGVAEMGSIITVELRDSNNNLVATYSNVPTSSNGTWAVDLQTAIPDVGNSPIAALVNGNSYNLSVTATDSNRQFISVPAVQKLVIDTSAPNLPLINSPSSVNDSTPIFMGTAEPGAMVELVIKKSDGSAATKYQTTADQGGWSIDFSTISPASGFLNVLKDGNYIVELVAIDAAGNRSLASTVNPFTIDTAAPSLPLFSSQPISGDNTPAIAGTSEPGSTVTVVIDGFTFTTTASNPGGTWSVDLQTAIPHGGNAPIGTLSDGVYPVTVTVTDPAGNTSAPAFQSLRVDTIQPSAPQVVFGNKTNDITPVLNGLAEPGSTVSLNINGFNFVAIAGPNGNWSVDLETAIPNGASTPISPLNNNQSYSVTVSVTDPAGNVSANTTQSLLVDIVAPASPIINSSPFTNQIPPAFSGTAEPDAIVTLIVNGATFTVQANSNGAWSIDTASDIPISGSLGSFLDGNYPVSISCADGANQSGVVTLNLTVDSVAPGMSNSGVSTSFGQILNLDESRADATISVNVSGIEDGQPASVQINGSIFTGTVFNGKAIITVPASALQSIADGSNPSLVVSATDRAGNTGSVAIPFSVDKTGPARPSFAGISSSLTDPTPGDPFTSMVNPTVVISGEPGQTIVITGPNGVVDPSSYTVTETNGLYTITFTVNQPGGDYRVNLRDANGNLNADGNDAQNYFRIDSVPTLFDNPERRSASVGSTYGNLAIKNVLNGQLFNVPQQADNSWVDLDGQTITFGLAGSTVIATNQNNDPTLVQVSINGATLRLNTITGAYTYTPLPMTDRTDSFLLTAWDANGNQTQLQLSFNSIDTLDRDGIVGVSESVLAGIVTGVGNSGNLAGDLNRDGVPDSNQNSVSTLAWRREADFQNAINPNMASNTDRAAVVCMVVNSIVFDPNTTTTLTPLMGDVDPLAQLLQIQVTTANGLLPENGNFYKPWDLMNFAVESLSSNGLTDINPDRPGTQIQVAIDISNANISTSTFGFSLYRKYISQQTLNDYSLAGITLTSLDNQAVATPGWYDYTQRTPGGDGATFRDFNNDGKLDAMIITLTDNAFGDDSPVRNNIVDPGTPGAPIPANPGGPNPSVPTPPGSFPTVPSITGFAATGRTIGAISGRNINIYPSNSTTPISTVTPFT